MHSHLAFPEPPCPSVRALQVCSFLSTHCTCPVNDITPLHTPLHKQSKQHQALGLSKFVLWVLVVRFVIGRAVCHGCCLVLCISGA